MTIKQQGGVFGRNPTFNDVTVEGNLNTSGTITLPDDSLSGDTLNGGVPVFDNVGIGSVPESYLHLVIDKPSGPAMAYKVSGSTKLLSGVATVTNGGCVGAVSGDYFTRNNGGNFFWSVDDGASPALKIDSSENTTVYGNLVIGTSGKGIDFSATAGTGTSELFDDYEEGTFTPTIVGSTSAGSGTYSTQSAAYTKVGNMVMFRMNLTWSAHTGTGFMRVNGLPFSITGNNTPFSSRFSGIVFSNVPSASGISGGTTIRLYNMAETSGATGEISMDTAGDLYVAGVYHT